MPTTATNPIPADVNAATPQRLAQFVGQRPVVQAVEVALQACRVSGASYPSSLFAGPPGLGKSQLVAILAAELGVRLRETLAQTLQSASDLQALLLEAQDGDIVFLDEADELSQDLSTLLYRALAERKLFVPRGRSSRSGVVLPLDDFTLILATNHESRLARPLVERFKIINRFEFYSASELEQLLRTRATGLGWSCDDAVVRAISTRGRGVPRCGLRILEAAHRVAVSENAATITAHHLERACAIDGIDVRGLDRTERAYLHMLADGNGAIRPGVIADRLGVPLRTLQSVVEPYLLREGLITRSDSGRSLTAEGMSYLRDAGL